VQYEKSGSGLRTNQVWTPALPTHPPYPTTIHLTNNVHVALYKLDEKVGSDKEEQYLAAKAAARKRKQEEVPRKILQPCLFCFVFVRAVSKCWLVLLRGYPQENAFQDKLIAQARARTFAKMEQRGRHGAPLVPNTRSADGSVEVVRPRVRENLARRATPPALPPGRGGVVCCPLDVLCVRARARARAVMSYQFDVRLPLLHACARAMPSAHF